MEIHSYFDENNKLHKKECIVCGDLLVHGNKVAKKILDELKEIKDTQMALNQALDDAGEPKGIPISLPICSVLTHLVTQPPSFCPFGLCFNFR